MIAAAILLGGNGLQGTLITLRANIEGFDLTLIGLMGTAYYLGFMVSSFNTIKLIRIVGHIRVFSALAAISASGSLLMILFPDAWFWIFVRFIAGFCFSGLLTVMESWINASSTNENRGQIFSVYRIVDMVSVTGLQFLLPIYGPEGFQLFVLVGILFCISLVPVSLSNKSKPAQPENINFNIKKIWLISPIACLGTLSIGLTNSSFRLIGPLYAQEVGFDTTGVVFFMSAGIIGGAVMQYPLGRFSDLYDRRKVLLLVTGCASLASLFITFFAHGHENLTYLGAFLFGSFALPLYSISIAHANDNAKAGEYVLVSAGLLFFFAMGASVGPLLASFMIGKYGAISLFIFISAVHGSLIVALLLRMLSAPSIANRTRTRFVALLRTSPVIFKLAKQSRKKPKSGSK